MHIIDKRRVIALLLVLTMMSTTTISSKASGYTTIDYKTFKNNYGITTIHIGSDVDEITSNAFRNLCNLREITVSENNLFYASYGGCLYDKWYTELVCFPPALKGTAIPSTVVSISTNALHGVPEDLKQQVRDVIECQASGNLPEADIPGAHFIHTDNGVKWKAEDGSIVQPDSLVMNLAAAVVEASSTGSMTQPQQLRAAFDFVADTITYERSFEIPSGDWTKEYAAKTLGTSKGNCYGYASAFAYIAKGLGYDARICTGTVTSSYGGRTAHAWTEVKMNNRWYVFDTEMQNAKGDGYYKQTYDSYPAGPLEKTSTYVVDL